MASMVGWDGTHTSPPLMDMWTKIQLGWVTPTFIGQGGTYEIAQSATTPQAYIIQKVSDNILAGCHRAVYRHLGKELSCLTQ
jgi:hypothetical protein